MDKVTQTIEKLSETYKASKIRANINASKMAGGASLNDISDNDSEDDLPLKSVLAKRHEHYGNSPMNEFERLKYADEILKIKEDLPWVSSDQCRLGLAKFDGNVEKATEWILTTMSESDVRHLEVQLVVVEGVIFWYRQKAAQTDEDVALSL